MSRQICMKRSGGPFLNEKRVIYVRSFLLAVSALFLIWGVYRGEMQTVLTKAVNICLECIGLG